MIVKIIKGLINWVTDSCEQRKNNNTCAKVQHNGYEKEGTFVVNFIIQDISSVITNAYKEICTVTPYL